jgi:hypothetical protein
MGLYPTKNPGIKEKNKNKGFKGQLKEIQHDDTGHVDSMDRLPV